MCRLLAYKGAPTSMNKLLYEPKNSIIHQSYDAHEIEEPLNGDGFGVGWYTPEIGPDPAVFVSVQPAWSNRNLRYISPVIKSPCILAHVRAASFGDTSEANCHPFHSGQFLMMHNGSIEGFDAIKRELRRRLSDESYSWVKGQTDSEHFFALFLDHVRARSAQPGLNEIADALEATTCEVEALKRAHNVKDVTYLNAVVTDGKSLVATRYCSSPSEEPPSLYYSSGSRYVCEGRTCRMVQADPREHAVLVVSEKLTSREHDWHKVPAGHMVLVDSASAVTVRRLAVDQERASA